MGKVRGLGGLEIGRIKRARRPGTLSVSRLCSEHFIGVAPLV